MSHNSSVINEFQPWANDLQPCLSFMQDTETKLLHTRNLVNKTYTPGPHGASSLVI